MAKETYTASEAAKALGISLDTLRRWDRARPDPDDSATAATAASSRRRRSSGCAATAGTAHLSARNRFKGVVTDVKIEGLMAQVELVVSEPVRLVAIVTREAVEELGSEAGMAATAVVKATSVMVES